MSGIVFTQQRSKDKLTGYQYVNKCDVQTCPISDACPHAQSVVQCKLHKDYMTGITNGIQELIATGAVDKVQLSIVCHNILPLYNHLFKFQILEMAQDSPVIYGKQLYMHPVYKEIRNTVKTIYELWRGIGVIKSNVPMGEMPVVGQSAASFIDALTSGTRPDNEPLSKQEQEAIAALPEDTADEDEEYLPQVKVPMARGEVQKAKQGMTGRAKSLFKKIDDAAQTARNSVKIAGEDENGNPILVDADFDPTKLPEDDIQTTFIDSLSKGGM